MNYYLKFRFNSYQIEFFLKLKDYEMKVISRSMIFRSLLCFFMIGLASQLHAAPANCQGLLKNYFDSVSNNSRMTPMILMAKTALWRKPPHGKSFTGHMVNWGTIADQAPNRLLQFKKGKTSFSDRNAFNGKNDETSIYIRENGTARIVLDTWGSASAQLIITSCNAMPDANNLLIQAVEGGITSRKAVYNFSLYTTDTLI